MTDRTGNSRRGAASGHRHALPAGHELLWYKVKEVLGQGAFGITYLCLDMNLHRDVAIKEYLPGALAMRDHDLSVQPISAMQTEEYREGLQRFINEARTLVRFEHPNIVRVLNIFEANNSAYMVMNYERGESLRAILKRRHTLPQKELEALAIPIMNGLIRIHEAGFIHRDIKPGNVFIRDADGSPVLLDFGSAREAMTEEVRTLTNFVSPGYAPIEQYTGKSDKQGPWTDIYGLGATLYKAVTGRLPTDAVERSEGLAHDDTDGLESTREMGCSGYSDRFLKAIDHALEFRAVDRPQSVADWMREFGFVSEVDTLPLAPVRQGLAEAGSAATPPGDDMGQSVAAEQETLLNITGETATVELQPPAAARHEARFAVGRGGWPLPVIIGVVLLLFALGLFVLPWSEDQKPASQVATVSPAISATAPATVPPDTIESASEAVATPPGTVAAGSSGDSAAVAPEAEGTERIRELLQRAEADLKALRLTTPAGDNALQRYRQVLRLDPENADARFGLKRIAATYRSLARHALDKGDLERAGVYLRRSAQLQADHPRQHELERLLAARRQPPAATGGTAQDAGGDAPEELDAGPAPVTPATPLSRGEEIRKRFGGH